MVNVNVTNAGRSSLIPNVPTAADCDAAGGSAWYYDDNANPTSISVCPATCDFITDVAGATIDVLFGCERKIELPE